MTNKKPKPEFPLCSKYGLIPDLRHDDCRYWEVFHPKDVEKALSKAEQQGKQEQYVETVNLFNKLRNNRFQFNDEVKIVIDMLKREMM